jgi:hypothetical protein
MIERPAPLSTIPLVDVCEGGTLRHAQEGVERLLGLRDACLSFLPRSIRPAMPLLDRIARCWLMRAEAPYVSEIEAIARCVGVSGVWHLNASYQWGCTALARDEDDAPWLARTLDWPFPGLGRYADIVQMRGEAGDFFSITWPGYVGALNAMAPGRFAACINQAPLWRRTRHRWLRAYDMVANALNTWRLRHTPPDQLLRRVFETCPDFAAARRMLEETPVARPVIFTLVGCGPGERCVIERTEESFVTHCDDTVAANDWVRRRDGWEARIAAQHFFSLSSAEAADNSRARRTALGAFSGMLSADDFGWVAPPVLNPYTRLAVAMCPARGSLRVQGFEPAAGRALPQPVTEIAGIDARLGRYAPASELSPSAVAVS